jgi:dimethylargininase
MVFAITREVGEALASCEISFIERTPIDIELARRQHAAYRDVLRTLGCSVIELPALPGMPDAVFVEDVAIVLDEIAVMTRPGAASRRAEGDSVARVLERHRLLRRIEAPGTLDGGDVLRIGRKLFVGQAARSNADGIAQLRECVDEFGYSVQPVATHGCLHLKSAVTQVGEGTVLVNPQWIDVSTFAGQRVIKIHPEEEHAANALRIGSRVIHPLCFPRTRQRLVDAGIDVLPVDVSELQKAEGAVTCCSVVFDA